MRTAYAYDARSALPSTSNPSIGSPPTPHRHLGTTPDDPPTLSCDRLAPFLASSPRSPPLWHLQRPPLQARHAPPCAAPRRAAPRLPTWNVALRIAAFSL